MMARPHLSRCFPFAVLLWSAGILSGVSAAPLGYYRQPTINKNTIVFVAEGDLWKVGKDGGVATRLTSHAGEEALPALSPDGRQVAFVGHYEGPGEVYVMPVTGGLPRRLTFDGGTILSVGWTPEGKVVVGTNAHSTLPSTQLVILEPSLTDDSVTRRLLPLAQATDGTFSPDGKILCFTRLPFQGSHTKGYQGGTAQNLWRFSEGDAEAMPLTANHKGTSKAPMWWQNRIYFVSDRDGTMNLWSMKPDGSDLKQHTHHKGWDVARPALSEGQIVYQLGADLHIYDIAGEKDRLLNITLDSDLDQMRERWVKKPMEYLTAAHIAPDGSKVVLTARGHVFVVGVKAGTRLVEASRKGGVRHRDARFLADGKSLLTLSDESDEVELWKLPANGVGPATQLTKTANVLRWEAIPSPDGKSIAHRDKNQRLFLYDVEARTDIKIDDSKVADFEGLAWSPDSRWLAYVSTDENLMRRIRIRRISDGKTTIVTSDRYDSYSPAWSTDGHWLYFLSDRNLKSVTENPFGTYQPEPFLDKKTKIYQLALLKDGGPSPFAPPDELHEDKDDKEDKKDPKKDEKKGKSDKKDLIADEKKLDPRKDKKKDDPDAEEVIIDLAGLAARLEEVPVPAGNYSSLTVNDKALFWLSTPSAADISSLQAVAIGNDGIDVKTVTSDVKDYDISDDGRKILVRKSDNLYVIDATGDVVDVAKKEIDLSDWALSIVPREEWRQLFVEAWRLERDYFYDRDLHGVDWAAVRKKYEPLVDRVASRAELSDLVSQMVSELGALHIFVRGGDLRKGTDDIAVGLLGAELIRDSASGGYRVVHLFLNDPDEPDGAGPLQRPGVKLKVGDVIEMVNGTPVLSVADLNLTLRRQAGKQVLLRVKPHQGGKARDVVVKPCTVSEAADLRYREWELQRRQMVEEKGQKQIGYVHLREMGQADFGAWARGFYPVFTRQGLIIDVRNNRGGNIDSWILERLLRKAWFYWSQRVGSAPNWNMQYAFRGHVVVLCNEETASDGEAFCEGIKRLKLGTVIGTRTWGGEIWLNADNFLADKGIATAAEFGVYGPEGAWLIEGHGVDPDIVVDNLPHATFKGKDAQLDAAIAHLQKLIKEQPVPDVKTPPFPKKGR